MSDQSMAGVQINLTTATVPKSAEPQADRPLLIAVLGDFTARQNRKEEDPKTVGRRNMIAVDRDNFDDVLRQLGVELQLAAGSDSGAKLTIAFQQLDDFHPDRIFERHDLFAALRQIRRKLLNRDTFREAAAEVSSWASPGSQAEQPSSPKPSESTQPPKTDTLRGADLLDATLAATRQESGQASAAGPETTGSPLVDQLIREVVAPHITPAPDPRQDDLARSVDEATSEQMRRILHDRDFQALEAIWRGLYFLVRRLDTGTRLKLLLVDVSRRELADDLAAGDDLSNNETYKLLIERTVGTAGGQPLGLLVGHFAFDSRPEDVRFLGRMAEIAAAAGAAFLAAASSNVVGCSSFVATPDPDDWRQPIDTQSSAAWSALRRRPEASRVGLALPRFLLRLPYGRQFDPVEHFEFEELTQPPSHGHYLWGNPAVACALLIGEAFSQHGWSMDLGEVSRIEGLPLHTYKEDGETQIKPCAEAWLGERAVRAIASEGLTPVLSVQGRDAIQINGLRSISDPPGPLAGPWSS